MSNHYSEYTSSDSSFEVYMACDYGMEDPQPGCSRGTRYEFAQKFDSYWEASRFADTCDEGEWHRVVIFTPQWYKDIQRDVQHQELTRSNAAANDPTDPNYVPF